MDSDKFYVAFFALGTAKYYSQCNEHSKISERIELRVVRIHLCVYLCAKHLFRCLSGLEVVTVGEFTRSASH